MTLDASTRVAAAKLAMLAWYAEAMALRLPIPPAPPLDPRIAAAGWKVLGVVTAVDAVLRPGVSVSLAPERVFYGFLAQSTTDTSAFVLVIRGTQGFVEWVIDGEFLLTVFPGGGHVEAGFYGLYRTMQYEGGPLVQGISRALGAGGELVVVGHSLGSALAQLAAYDLAGVAPGRVMAQLFASPRAGDAAFCATCDARYDHEAYSYDLDIVPRVPFGLGYCPPSNSIVLDESNAQAALRITPFCSHHVLSYAAMLDYAAAAWLTDFPEANADYGICLKGPLAVAGA